MTPFFANYGYHPRMFVSVDDSPVPAAKHLVDQIHLAHEQAKESIAQVQEKYRLYANRHRLPDPDFKPGDRVWLRRLHIKAQRPSDKLDEKKLGPFEVQCKIGRSAYRLVLPSSMRVHPTFHVSLLERFYPNRHPERMHEPPPPLIVHEGEQFYRIERILDSKFARGKLPYFVKWEGYPDSSNSWETGEDYDSTNTVVREFHFAHPDRPGYEIGTGHRRPRAT